MPPEFIDAFYVERYTDAQAVNDPSLSPRRKRREGPYRTYESAQWNAERASCTHYKIDKVRVSKDVEVHFKDDHSDSRPPFMTE